MQFVFCNLSLMLSPLCVYFSAVVVVVVVVIIITSKCSSFACTIFLMIAAQAPT